MATEDRQIRFKRGADADIDATATVNQAVEGEPHYATDTDDLYVSPGTTETPQFIGGGTVWDGNKHLTLPAGTATSAPLTLTAGTGLTTPAPGTIEFHDDRFYVTHVGTQRAIDRTSAVKITTTTVVNTTTETTLHTGPLAANALKVGNLLKFDANGIISSFNAAQVLTIRFYIGLTEVTSKTITGSTFTNEPWDATIILAVRSVGVSGSVSVHGGLDYGGAAFSTTSKQSSSIETIDTTISEDLTITAQWGTANAGNTVSATQGFFEFKN